MLSPEEVAALGRGRTFKRYVRAASALAEMYDDSELGKAVGMSRGAVSAWWRGAKPEPGTLSRLAEAVGLSTDELTRFVYYDGPPPSLPVHPDSAATSAARAGLRRDQDSRADEAPQPPSGSPTRRPRGSGAGRE